MFGAHPLGCEKSQTRMGTLSSSAYHRGYGTPIPPLSAEVPAGRGPPQLGIDPCRRPGSSSFTAVIFFGLSKHTCI